MKDKKEIWMQKTMIIWLGALLCCLLWGSAFPAIKIGYQILGIGADDSAAQLVFAGYRFTLAGILAVIIGSISAKKVLIPGKKSWGKVVLLGLIQTVLQYYFYYIGLAHTSGVKAAIVVSMNVFFSILIASLIFRQERLTAAKIMGCAVGFAGVILVNLNGMDLQFQLSGEGRILLSGLAYSFSSVMMKIFSKEEHPVTLSGYQFISGGIILSLMGIAMGGNIQISSTSGWIILLHLALVSAVAYSVWGILLKYNPVSRVSVFSFMTPVFGVILSAVFLGEGTQAKGINSVIALILVCVGIYIVNRPQKKGA